MTALAQEKSGQTHPSPAPASSPGSVMVGAPDDRLEQEAEQAARSVMRMPYLGEDPAAFLSQAPVTVSRQSHGGGTCAQCQGEAHDGDVARRRSLAVGSAGPFPAPAIVEEVLRSPGQALEPGVRAFMEPRFGYDFSQVRVHTDTAASESAACVDALAYTAGKDVVFGTGRYSPASVAGRALLAHELSHVIQQHPLPGISRPDGAGHITGQAPPASAPPQLSRTEMHPLTIQRQPATVPQQGKPFPWVRDLYPPGSLSDQQWSNPDPTKPYADAASIAHTELIGMSHSANDINVLGHGDPLKPGLNYDSEFQKKKDALGDTTMLGSASTQSDIGINAAALNNRAATPPAPDAIAIRLGPDALKNKVSAVGVLRHEMRHASDMKLTIAWNLRWRSSQTTQSFGEWLRNQQKKKPADLSKANLDIILAIAEVGDTGPIRSIQEQTIQLPAHIEGMVATLPFLPPPNLKELPEFVNEITYAVEDFRLSQSNAVKMAAKQRLHDAYCQALSSDQQANFIAWIDFLTDPGTIKPSASGELQTQKIYKGLFRPYLPELKELRAAVTAKC